MTLEARLTHRGDVERVVRTLIGGLASRPVLDPAETLHDLGMGSLDLVRLIVGIEDALALEFLDDELEFSIYSTVEELEDLVQRKVPDVGERRA